MFCSQEWLTKITLPHSVLFGVRRPQGREMDRFYYGQVNLYNFVVYLLICMAVHLTLLFSLKVKMLLNDSLVWVISKLYDYALLSTIFRIRWQNSVFYFQNQKCTCITFHRKSPQNQANVHDLYYIENPSPHQYLFVFKYLTLT